MTPEEVERNRAVDPEWNAIVAIVRRDFPGSKMTYFTDGKKIRYGQPGPPGVPLSEPLVPPKRKGEK